MTHLTCNFKKIFRAIFWEKVITEWLTDQRLTDWLTDWLTLWLHRTPFRAKRRGPIIIIVKIITIIIASWSGVLAQASLGVTAKTASACLNWLALAKYGWKGNDNPVEPVCFMWVLNNWLRLFNCRWRYWSLMLLSRGQTTNWLYFCTLYCTGT